MQDQFINEVKLQMYVDTPHVTKVYGYFCNVDKIYLIMEYMEEGSLFQLIKK